MYILLRRTHMVPTTRVLSRRISQSTICAQPAANSTELRAGHDYQAAGFWGPTPGPENMV